MKEFSIKLSDYIQYKKPNYIFLKVKPSNSIRNYNSDVLLSIVGGLYRTINNQMKIIDKKLFFESNAKMSYYIYMEKQTVQFYFIVPEVYYGLFKDKIIDVWKNKVTITQVDDIPMFDKDALKFYMTYKEEDAFSLTCDKRNNVLLNSMFNTIHIMEEGDKLGVFYNFAPAYQKNWQSRYDRTIEKKQHNLPTSKNKISVTYVCMYILLKFAELADLLISSLSKKEQENKTLQDLRLDTATTSKKHALIVNTQILCFSNSEDKYREYNNLVSVCQAFECLDSDNRLVRRRYRKEFNLLDTKIKGAETMKIQPKEGQNFISLPGMELLNEHVIIEHTNILETEVPKELQQGYISLGISTYKGNPMEAFLRDNYDQGNFPLVLIGEQGSGKTTFLSNYAKNIIQRNEGCMLIDFIKNCELADTIKDAVPPDRVIELDMTNIKNAQGIGYNELKPKTNDLDELMDVANRKAIYIQMLIDALNVDGDPLSSSMDRYLSAATNIVFLNNYASLKDVVRCLNDHEYRKKCIDSVPILLRESLEEEISALTELDEVDGKSGMVKGTRMSRIDGINHRINLLRKDLRLKMMFNKSCDHNINLVNAMNEGKIILVKMPQEYFATPYSKNVIVTYLFTKIWAAQLIRGGMEKEPKRFHVIVDEVFQAKTAMKLLKEQEILPQTRKFGCKFVFSCQYLGQIDLIDQTLRSAGASYMLMKGSGKANFNEFKDELAPYTLEDMEALPQYHSLNLINYDKKRAKFITKLPKPL